MRGELKPIEIGLHCANYRQDFSATNTIRTFCWANGFHLAEIHATSQCARANSMSLQKKLFTDRVKKPV
jgi:hypothetical protein